MNNLAALLKDFTDRGAYGNALAVSVGGSVGFEHYNGFARDEKPVESDTLFRVHSMTKLVTCAAALRLFERGKFDLNEPVCEYLPEFEKHDKILIKHLFSMSSGYPYPWGDTPACRALAEKLKDFDGDSREFCQIVSSVTPDFEPGTRWCYGFSHDIIGAMIERITNKTLQEFFQTEIFAPLGMTQTTFKVHDLSRLAGQYKIEKGKISLNHAADNECLNPPKFAGGGTGIICTATDYLKFASALANKYNDYQLLSPKTIDLMRTDQLTQKQRGDYNWPHLAGYGYGLGVRTMIDLAAAGSNGSIGEFGWCGYAGAYVLIDPAESLAAVYMHNLVPNIEGYVQPRLRAALYAGLAEWRG